MPDFVDLYDASHDPSALRAAYGTLMGGLERAPFWQAGEISGQRVRWSDAFRARDDASAFDSPGLYIWGADQRPLYIGITESSFRKRFSRYIWSKRSQCHLAQAHGSAIVATGIDGFPEDIRAWYRKGYGNSTVRLEGAVRFAREGLDHIWFALLPSKDKSTIKPLEARLIPVANSWGIERGFMPLLNIDHA